IEAEMNQTKYEIKYGDMGARPGGKLDPDQGRILFTGADVWQVVFAEAPNVAKIRGRRVLQEKDFADAIEKVYRYNRKSPSWLGVAKKFVIDEIDDYKNQDDERRERDERGPRR
ncbi:MAG: hypothetical protein MRECE_8c001, partial [Mycoplasmataceae bacterium CE_OT135]